MYLIWKYELAPRVLEPSDGAVWLGSEEETNAIKQKNKQEFQKVKRLSKLGLSLVLTGFSLQIIANFVNYYLSL